MKLKSLICEERVPKISLQQAKDAGLFGPVYHGTNQDNIEKIGQEGFKLVIAPYGASGMSNGYQHQAYGFSGPPPPIHHLGFGIYFTTVLSIAKKYNGGTTRGLRVYFLKIPKHETINFGATNTMMKWWIKNGYDPELAKQGEEGRYNATIKLTNELKSKWDAVWFKGKGLHTLLDGDQVCVFEPEGKIFEIDLTLSKGFDVGAKVKAKKDIVHLNVNGQPYGPHITAGTVGIIKSRREIDPYWKEKYKEYPNNWLNEVDKYVLNVKWKIGGQLECADTSVEPLNV